MVLDRHAIDDVKLWDNFSERCPSCKRHLTGSRMFTIVSPFLIIYNDGNSLKDYPSQLMFTYKTAIGKQELKYDLSYIGMKMELELNDHYTSFSKLNDNFWYHLEVLDSDPNKRFVSLPGDITAVITFVVYLCVAATEFAMERKPPKK